MPSAVNFCKQFGSRSGPTNAGPDLDTNCLTLLWCSKNNFSKKLILKKKILKKKSADEKKNVKFPIGEKSQSEIICILGQLSEGVRKRIFQKC